MLPLFEGIEEYNNQGALIGLEAFEDAEVMGALAKMNPVTKVRVMKKMTNTGAPSRGSRAEFEKYFNDVPEHIRKGIRNGELRLADALIYSIKPVTSKTIKLFEPQDDKDFGLRNISNAKLPKNQALLVSGIYLLAATAAGTTKDDIDSAQFKGLENFNALASGEFGLKANRKIIVPEISNKAFKTQSFNGVPEGFLKLANPRVIRDEEPIEAYIELGTMLGIPDNTHVFVGLYGTITTP